MEQYKNECERERVDATRVLAWKGESACEDGKHVRSVRACERERKRERESSLIIKDKVRRDT